MDINFYSILGVGEGGGTGRVRGPAAMWAKSEVGSLKCRWPGQGVSAGVETAGAGWGALQFAMSSSFLRRNLAVSPG